jgi:hypothetical protein
VPVIEIVCGMVFTAIMTGLLFVRFSKPRPRILYADQAVVTSHNCSPTLMVRIANAHNLADQCHEVLDVPVQTRRNKRAALKLMRKLLKKYDGERSGDAIAQPGAPSHPDRHPSRAGVDPRRRRPRNLGEQSAF